jgi:phosphoribosylformimino-5-aminoimidazole carboxamide ribotide isomerase
VAAVILYPAIDLKDGACVRLVQGEMAAATRFNDDPAAQARSFAAAGCRWLHVVDLNGAFAGRPVNGQAVSAIIAAVGLPIQLGGGIRELATIEYWLAAGISRVILGTIAVKNPDLVKEACRRFPGSVAVGIDARGGRVAVEGWAESSDLTAFELARRFEDVGVACIIYTDIERDGLLSGVNVTATAALAERIAIPVIASGGIGSLEDLLAVKAAEGKGIQGVICGRALYDGRVDLARAIEALEAPC